MKYLLTLLLVLLVGCDNKPSKAAAAKSLGEFPIAGLAHHISK